jgi:hypothetical protein
VSRVERFALAPMNALIRGLTILMLLLPVALFAAALLADRRLLAVAFAVTAIYVVVYLAARPIAFEVGDAELAIRFPLWTRRVACSSILGAREFDGAALRAELGLALRVGAGGLWGGFGWLWSRRRGWVELYVSRTDGLVWIERRAAIPLLITPERPAELVARLPARGT